MQAYKKNPIKQKARTAWRNMKRRCYNPNHRDYHRYGGRGIKVCNEWQHSFLPFYEWSLTHGIEPGLTIERIDNDADYSPNNCVWATSKKQGNNRSTNVFVEFNGERKTAQQWADSIGITNQAMVERLNSDTWSLEEALTTPPGGRKVQQPAFRKRIVQISTNGNAIKTWESVTEAAKALNSHTSNISRALANGSTACGFRWEYQTGGEI